MSKTRKRRAGSAARKARGAGSAGTPKTGRTPAALGAPAARRRAALLPRKGAGGRRSERGAAGKTVRPAAPVNSNARAALPPIQTMLRAVAERDTSFEGLFFLGVTTTGIFCRPGCPARTPRPEHIVFFPDADAAQGAGFRACLRCTPLARSGEAPEWLKPLLGEIEEAPNLRLRDADLRARGLVPERVRRWFLARHGTTFHGYQRARRIGKALGELAEGAGILDAGLENGFESASGFAEALARITGLPPGASREMPRLAVERIPTPLGPMVAAATDRALWLLEFADRRMLATQLARVARASGGALVPGTSPPIAKLREELDEYFAGKRRRFTVPVITAGTEFQEKVWSELRRIPYGETRSYAELAAAVGRPTAVRAVGRANGDNRLAIVIPCHRVVGASGELTGYGGGVWRKRHLLLREAGEEAAHEAPTPRTDDALHRSRAARRPGDAGRAKRSPVPLARRGTSLECADPSQPPGAL